MKRFCLFVAISLISQACTAERAVPSIEQPLNRLINDITSSSIVHTSSKSGSYGGSASCYMNPWYNALNVPYDIGQTNLTMGLGPFAVMFNNISFMPQYYFQPCGTIFISLLYPDK